MPYYPIWSRQIPSFLNWLVGHRIGVITISFQVRPVVALVLQYSIQ